MSNLVHTHTYNMSFMLRQERCLKGSRKPVPHRRCSKILSRCAFSTACRPCAQLCKTTIRLSGWSSMDLPLKAFEAPFVWDFGGNPTGGLRFCDFAYWFEFCCMTNHSSRFCFGTDWPFLATPCLHLFPMLRLPGQTRCSGGRSKLNGKVALFQAKNGKICPKPSRFEFLFTLVTSVVHESVWNFVAFQHVGCSLVWPVYFR